MKRQDFGSALRGLVSLDVEDLTAAGLSLTTIEVRRFEAPGNLLPAVRRRARRGAVAARCRTDAFGRVVDSPATADLIDAAILAEMEADRDASLVEEVGAW